jgi:septal ring-binding cell division protein DamX
MNVAVKLHDDLAELKSAHDTTGHVNPVALLGLLDTLIHAIAPKEQEDGEDGEDESMKMTAKAAPASKTASPKAKAAPMKTATPAKPAAAPKAAAMPAFLMGKGAPPPAKGKK